MAPLATPAATQLKQIIYYHLDNNLLRNALFLAQRLSAYDSRSAEATFLLAHCQYQSGYVKASWDTCRSYAMKGVHLGCCYVFAQASLELGRLVDGLHALEKSRSMWQHRNTWNQHNEMRRQHLPDAAAVWCLKGKLWKAHKNADEAVQCWVSALKLNPFMWDAYLGLCESGAKISVPNIYKLNPEMISMVHGAYPSKPDVQAGSEKNMSNFQLHNHTGNQQIPTDPFISTQKPSGNLNNSVLFEKLNNSKVSVNTASTILDEESLNNLSSAADADDSMIQNIPSKWEIQAAPMRKVRSVTEMPVEPPPKFKANPMRAKSRLRPPSDESGIVHEPPPPGPPSKRTISGQVASSSMTATNGAEPIRRSTRSQTSRPPSSSSTTSKTSAVAAPLGLREAREIKKIKAPTMKSRMATSSTMGRIVSNTRAKIANPDTLDTESKEIRNPSAPSMPQLQNIKMRVEVPAEKDLEALNTLLDLLCRLASAHLALSNFNCDTAIKIYNSLPSSQRETPYVLSQIGKSYYEQAQYAEAEKYFIKVRQVAPSRLDDMEYYSTTLWHLKSEIELAYLAHELIEVERHSPQAWVAIGNSFSLRHEHEQALKCFRRATQLDPSFAYGFTLQGHEYVANEEFEKALDAYRSAIASDDRHYNAWYGLGKVYEKLGKWSTAEQHYRTAARINPSNAVLTCCIGMVLEKLKQPERALDFYTQACKLAPKSALSRFKKARCLMSLGRPIEALDELNVLKDVAPDEANVWFLMGRLYKMTRQKAKAVKAFTMALNLDPKAAQYIKDAMETLDEEDEMGMDEDAAMD